MIAIIVIGLLTVGYLSNDVYRDWSNKRIVDGLRFETSNSWNDALKVAQSRDSYGDWVCINIRGMEYSRAVQVVNHEVGHEIFAEECENNFTKCLDVVVK